jgi:hypothetical protein
MAQSPFDALEPKPAPVTPQSTPGRTAFPAGPKTGPISDHRDGGGPERGDEGDLPPY